MGPGTFLGVKSEKIEDHKMHGEWYELKAEVAERLNKLKKNGSRIIAVGTTATRVLESCVNNEGELVSGRGETEIFIYPPYKFRFIDGLITNFHLPKSTLLMLVSAFTSWPNSGRKFDDFGSSLVGRAYSLAKELEYRFFSFGDAMFIS